MRKIPAIFSLLLFTVCFFQACEVENCPPNALSFAHFSLVNQYGQPVSTAVPTSVYGLMKADVTVKDTLPDGTLQDRVVHDSIIRDTLINKEANLKSFKVPLSFSNETQFILDYNGQGQDIITVQHKNIPYFMNIDCGTMMFHQVTGVTNSRGIDSIQIINPNIDNYEKENFKIYFTVADSE